MLGRTFVRLVRNTHLEAFPIHGSCVQRIPVLTTPNAHNVLRRFQSDDSSPPPQELSKAQRLKLAVRDYGSTVIVFHVGISLISLGGFYTAVSSGLDVQGLVLNLPYIGEKISANSMATGASTFVIAYGVHKVFAPVRISITLASVPFIVRYLRAKGILKVKK